ncbi:hypothetical protein DFH11DRAFT_1512332 [Phellopilus nigrolimitatus]|nr:hypothetical protein DFH11DRAFT_1512332 [Phellopilus nigrolimitatus]
MSLDHAEILLQEAVYVKWAFDAKRVEALRDEAAIYAARLTPLQGTVVPRLVGFYESVDHANPFALSIFEHCSGPVLSDYAEYSRQYMMAACALHGVGVSHNQLALGLRGDARFVDRHVIADQAGRVRIVDFTRATLHFCPGAPLRVAGGAPAEERRGCCDELAHLEIVVGERRTGDRATGRWLLD